MAQASESRARIEQCASLQEEEWDVLESIYPDYLSNHDRFSVDRTVTLEIPVELGATQPRHVVLDLERDEFERARQNGNTSNEATSMRTDSNQQTILSLSTLPPLLLHLNIPLDYPIYKPPVIVSIHASYSWVPKRFMKTLEDTLLNMWEEERLGSRGEGRGVLYDWIEMIRSAEFLNDLGFADSEAIRIPHPAPALFSSQLASFDMDIRSTRFSQNAYTCEICLTSIKGAKCILLKCEHVFCRACLMEFWQLCISEGDVDRVGCPDPKCVKECVMAEEEDMRRVVTEEEVKRWKWLKEKQEMEKDPTVVHCLMPFCQALVKKADVEEGSGWERFRNCSVCGYSFCAFCRRTWHGPHAECLIASKEEFVEEYLALPEDSAGRQALERRYGRENVLRLIKKYEEDKANKKLLDTLAVVCPGCQIFVEKSLGCNHMTCTRCCTHFCYRCGDKLGAARPYDHFSLKGHPCYSKLFDLERLEENEWQPIQGLDL